MFKLSEKKFLKLLDLSPVATKVQSSKQCGTGTKTEILTTRLEDGTVFIMGKVMLSLGRGVAPENDSCFISSINEHLQNKTFFLLTLSMPQTSVEPSLGPQD